LPAFAATALIATTAGTLGWYLRPAPRAPTSRLAILAPGLGGTGGSSSLRHLAFEPGGEALVYSLVSPEGNVYLVRQALWDENPTPIPGATQVNSPLVSPDGRFVLGTRVQDGAVYRIPMAGGTPQQVRIAMGARTSDAAWAPDGTLWFNWIESDAYRLYQLVGDSLVVRLRGSSGQFALQQILPDGKTALVVQSRIGLGGGPVALVDLETGKETPLRLPVAQVIEARVTQGYLVYTTTTATLQAARIDLRRRQLVGSPITLATNVSITGSGLAQMAVGENGNIAYVPEEPYSLVFVERNGSSRVATPERRNFHHPMFSPDGRRLSTDFSTTEGRNVWVLDLAERTLSRATFDPDGHDATWSPDGRFLSYIAPVSSRGGQLALLRKPPGTAEPAETLFSSPRLAYTGVWLRDGSGLITTGIGLRRDTLRADSLQPDTRTDIGIIRNAGRGPLEPLVASPFAEAYAQVSPDGRWLAFVSDQSGRDEVYIRDRRGSGDQVLVSNGGGTEPVWSPDGRELYYRETEAGAHLVSATIATSPAPRVLARTRLFAIGDIVATNPHANYDISPDGTTFVMVKRSPAARIVVIQNLPGLVQKLQGSAPTP
jgi:serine/threonine-protein kinase